jgi:hypothetical protein
MVADGYHLLQKGERSGRVENPCDGVLRERGSTGLYARDDLDSQEQSLPPAQTCGFGRLCLRQFQVRISYQGNIGGAGARL